MNLEEPDKAKFDKLDPLSELDLEIAKQESRLKRWGWGNSLWVWIVTIVFFGVGFVFRSTKGQFFSIPRMQQTIGLSLMLYGISAPLIYAYMRALRVGNVQAELDQLIARRRVLSRFTNSPLHDDLDHKSPNYFDSLVKINVENLAAYYALVKVQTDKSFTVSVTAGAIGFILILMGLLFGFTATQNSRSLAFVSAGAGVITEFISGVFFYLYNQTVRQMKGYHDSLLSVQNVLLSLKLVGDTKADDSEKVKMVTQMLSYLIGNESKSIAFEAGGTRVTNKASSKEKDQASPNTASPSRPARSG